MCSGQCRALNLGLHGGEREEIVLENRFMLCSAAGMPPEEIVIANQVHGTRVAVVTENDKGKLRWTAIINGQQVVETSEPQASRWLRFKAWIMRIFPEGQL